MTLAVKVSELIATFDSAGTDGQQQKQQQQTKHNNCGFYTEWGRTGASAAGQTNNDRLQLLLSLQSQKVILSILIRSPDA